MTPERWLRVKELFHDALELNSGDREAFLARACAQDSPLRAEVERLLNAHEVSTSLSERARGGRNAMAAGKMRPSLTGLTIGRYEVGRLIGAGGMGEVYAARDLELGRDVALKVGIARGSDAHSRLKREAQHASRLNHPNICTIHEVGTHDAQPFIIMELVDGRPLTDIIPPDGLSADVVVRYGTQIADAVAHAHRHRVTHRDLKSANVLITPEGRTKVLDFGLARALPREKLESFSHSRESITGEGLVAGTLSVMAPEVLRGEKSDERSDIWSLGVLLYEMACGTRPFRGATGFELSGAILHAPPQPLPDRVPSVLVRIIHRCLEKDPRDRYQSAGEVRAALEGHADAIGNTAEPLIESRARPMSVRFRRIVVASFLMAVAGYGAYALWRNDGPVAVGASGRPAIAVMQFDNVGAESPDSKWLSSGVPSMLATGLAQTQGLEIVSAGRLQDALRQNGGTSLAALDRTAAAEVARRAGAGAIVVGGIFRSGNEIRIDAQLEDLTSGRVLAAESVRGTDVFALVDELASEIREAVGFSGAQGVRNVATVSSTSLEAYRLYSEGTEAVANVRMADAERLLKAAVKIDPSFAEAYMWLAHVAGSLGRKAERQEYYKLARDHADRLSERHRLLLDVEAAREKEDYVQARRALDEVLLKFPDFEDAYPLAAQLYPTHEKGPSTQRLLEITSAGVAALPSSSHARNTHGYALLAAGRYDEAVRQFDAYARIAPREPNPYDSMGEAYLKMGDARKAIDSYTRALTIDPTFPSSRSLRAWSFAVLGRYDEALAEPIDYTHFRAVILARTGRYREAAQVLADGETRATQRDDRTRAAGLRAVGALLAVERRDHARGLRDIQAAEKMFAAVAGDTHMVRSFNRLLAGLAHLQAGRLPEAALEFEAQGRTYKDTNDVERSWRHALEAEIALSRGELDKAASAFAAGEPALRTLDPNFVTMSVLFNDLPTRDGLARVAVARGDLAEAIRIYRGLLDYGPDDKYIAAFEPRYVLQIARLLEKNGDQKSALAEYQRFLTYWKNADSDLPELTEARRAAARLT